MKKIVVLMMFAVVVFACGQNTSKNETASEEAPVKEAVVLSIDDVLAQASDLADQEVTVKGTVMHVCQHGGQRCFLMGSGEEVTIRIEAGEEIGAFTQEQMGSELQIVGVLKEVKTEADAHNPGAEHAEGEMVEDAETENAHNIIAANQAAVEREFFIEGVSVKEL